MKVLETEWFCLAAQTDSTESLLEDFLANLKRISFSVFCKVINLADSSVSLIK